MANLEHSSMSTISEIFLGFTPRNTRSRASMFFLECIDDAAKKKEVSQGKGAFLTCHHYFLNSYHIPERCFRSRRKGGKCLSESVTQFMLNMNQHYQLQYTTGPALLSVSYKTCDVMYMSSVSLKFSHPSNGHALLVTAHQCCGAFSTVKLIVPVKI